MYPGDGIETKSNQLNLSIYNICKDIQAEVLHPDCSDERREEVLAALKEIIANAEISTFLGNKRSTKKVKVAKVTSNDGQKRACDQNDDIF